MDSTAAPANPIRRLGWITFALGILNLVRLVPEFLAFGSEFHLVYGFFLGIDVVVGLLGVVAGRGLLKREAWIWEPCAVFWGAVAANSGILLGFILPHVLEDLRRRPPMKEELILSARLLFYAMSLLATPYALWVLIVRPDPDRPPGRTIWWWLAASVISGSVFPVVLILR